MIAHLLAVAAARVAVTRGVLIVTDAAVVGIVAASLHACSSGTHLAARLGGKRNVDAMYKWDGLVMKQKSRMRRCVWICLLL